MTFSKTLPLAILLAIPFSTSTTFAAAGGGEEVVPDLSQQMGALQIGSAAGGGEEVPDLSQQMGALQIGSPSKLSPEQKKFIMENYDKLFFQPGISASDPLTITTRFLHHKDEKDDDKDKFPTVLIREEQSTKYIERLVTGLIIQTSENTPYTKEPNEESKKLLKANGFEPGIEYYADYLDPENQEFIKFILSKKWY